MLAIPGTWADRFPQPRPLPPPISLATSFNLVPQPESGSLQDGSLSRGELMPGGLNPMRPNPTKEKLRRGEMAVGMMLLGADPHVVGVLAATGYDFVMFDMEHTSLSFERLERLVHAADAAGITPMTRVSSPSRTDILRALETGVRGLMVPMVESAAAAADAARFARYSPEGERGVYFLGYPSGYGGRTLAEHFAGTND